MRKPALPRLVGSRPTRTVTACAGFEGTATAAGAAAGALAGALAWLVPGDAARAGSAGGFGALLGAAGGLQAANSSTSKHNGSWARRGRSRARPPGAARDETVAIAPS